MNAAAMDAAAMAAIQLLQQQQDNIGMQANAGMSSSFGMPSTAVAMSPWQCDACGFSNGPRNEICGGNGPLGCKTPRENSTGHSVGQINGGAQSFGPAKGQGKGKSRLSPLDESFWICPHCNFKNRSSNEVCGGNGPVGCKNARPEAMSILGTGLGESDWACSACSFRNKSSYTVCGGKSALGCKAPRELADAILLAADPAAAFGDLSILSHVGDWVCSKCNFRNKSSNTICGGKGPVGCKAPRTIADSSLGTDCAALGKSAQGKGSYSLDSASDGGFKGACGEGFKGGWDGGLDGWGKASYFKGSSPPSCPPNMENSSPDPDSQMQVEISAMMSESDGAHNNAGLSDWMCASCNFRNVGRNSVCGGKGPVGCKMRRGKGSYPLESAGVTQSAQQQQLGTLTLPINGSLGKGSCNSFKGSQGISPEEMAQVPLGGLGPWICQACGYKNIAGNGICGGLGATGCKLKRPLPRADPLVLAALKAELAAEEAAMSDMWQCSVCNFKNRQINLVCGGNGPVGCKTPRDGPGVDMPQEMIVDRTKRKGQESNWTCRCGFKNTMNNEVCGGGGPLGCKSPKPFTLEASIGPTGATTPNGMQNVMPNGVQNNLQNPLPIGMQIKRPSKWDAGAGEMPMPNLAVEIMSNAGPSEGFFAGSQPGSEGFVL